MNINLFRNPTVWLILFAFCLFVGCANPARPSAMIGREIPQVSNVHDPVIVVTLGGEKSGPSTAMTSSLISLISNEDFSSALIQSLRKTGLFKSVTGSGGATFRLETTLEDLSQPEKGFSLTVNLKVDWRLIRISDNKVLWHEKIISTYTATVGDAFVAVKRIRLATEGAARQNIEKGLAKLAAVNF